MKTHHFASGDQVNVFITAGYEIKAKKDIEIDEDFFNGNSAFEKFCVQLKNQLFK